MALPPEPLADVLPEAALILVGEVTAAGPAEPGGEGSDAPDPRGIGAAPARGPQSVKIKVERVLRPAPGPNGGTGAADPEAEVGTELSAEKPAGAYVLVAGHRGVFLLDEGRSILGRYGPETWSVAEIKAALGAGAPTEAGQR